MNIYGSKMLNQRVFIMYLYHHLIADLMGNATGSDCIIITACNSAYAALATDLVRSIRDKRSLADVPIGVLDVGLTSVDRDGLAVHGVTIREIGWDLEFPGKEKWQQKLPGYKAMVSRSFLREHFPGYQVYMWMDADTWVQCDEAVVCTLGAARSDALIIAPEFDRQYFQYLKGPPIWQIFRDWYEHAFGKEIADRMSLRPLLNCGVFALRADAPHWEIWRRIHMEGMKRNADVSPSGFMLEQLALNVAVYLQNLPVCLMPVRFNWLCHHAMPEWDPNSSLFVEAGLPHDPIAILHLSQKNKDGVFDLRCSGSDGATKHMPLRYSDSSVS